jgi:hypothetical protein
MDHRERKIFSGDPACVGIILLVVLWLLLLLPTPHVTPVFTHIEPIVMTSRDR